MIAAGSTLFDAIESNDAPIRRFCRKGRYGVCRVEVEGRHSLIPASSSPTTAHSPVWPLSCKMWKSGLHPVWLN